MQFLPPSNVPPFPPPIYASLLAISLMRLIVVIIPSPCFVFPSVRRDLKRTVSAYRQPTRRLTRPHSLCGSLLQRIYATVSCLQAQTAHATGHICAPSQHHPHRNDDRIARTWKESSHNPTMHAGLRCAASFLTVPCFRASMSFFPQPNRHEPLSISNSSNGSMRNPHIRSPSPFAPITLDPPHPTLHQHPRPSRRLVSASTLLVLSRERQESMHPSPTCLIRLTNPPLRPFRPHQPSLPSFSTHQLSLRFFFFFSSQPLPN